MPRNSVNSGWSGRINFGLSDSTRPRTTFRLASAEHKNSDMSKKSSLKKAGSASSLAPPRLSIVSSPTFAKGGDARPGSAPRPDSAGSARHRAKSEGGTPHEGQYQQQNGRQNLEDWEKQEVDMLVASVVEASKDQIMRTLAHRMQRALTVGGHPMPRKLTELPLSTAAKGKGIEVLGAKAANGHAESPNGGSEACAFRPSPPPEVKDLTGEPTPTQSFQLSPFAPQLSVIDCDSESDRQQHQVGRRVPNQQLSLPVKEHWSEKFSSSRELTPRCLDHSPRPAVFLRTLASSTSELDDRAMPPQDIDAPALPVVNGFIKETAAEDTEDADANIFTNVGEEIGSRLHGMTQIWKEHRRPVFADESHMKELIRSALYKPVYSVFDYYHDEGCIADTARSTTFEVLTLLVITINSVWIAVDTDLNTAVVITDADPLFQLADIAFCLYFSFELLIRFLAFRDKTNCLKDAWFVFDTGLVTLMVGETCLMPLLLLAFSIESASGIGNASILRMLRLCRLVRMARMAKLLKAMPELVVICRGIVAASRSVFFTVTLLFIVTYVFSVLFVQATDDTEIGFKYFDTVPDAMKNILVAACMPDLGEMVEHLSSQSTIVVLVFAFYLLTASFALLNVLVGVVLEAICVISSVEKERNAAWHVREAMEGFMNGLKYSDEDENTISIEEFQILMVDEQVIQFLQSVGVDVLSMVEFAEVVFKEKEELQYGDVISLILDLRGEKAVTMADVVKVQKWIQREIEASTRVVSLMLEDQLGFLVASDDGAPRRSGMGVPCAF
eukprot:TRINITY_DN25519_c0_g1_i1.p1 TRINITY_DN25519_c0_g1~~TRINITY_DN25519_c0_g1_i1.p1  ORF type:complete len:786 (+),score=176.20 TRINITY_DN25519_c0_g1_i1:75-2432(+)